MPGWLPVLPVPGSIIPAFPLAWSLRQLLVLLGILAYFYFIYYIYTFCFLFPWRRNQPLLLPSPPTPFVPPPWCVLVAALILCHGEKDLSLSLLLSSLFPSLQPSFTFPSASGHSRAQAQRKRPNPAHNRPFPAGKVFLGRHK